MIVRVRDPIDVWGAPLARCEARPVRYASRRSKTDLNGHATLRTIRLDAVFIEL
jgi:hypothetical protein